jgi:hypothetical protein
LVLPQYTDYQAHAGHCGIWLDLQALLDTALLRVPVEAHTVVEPLAEGKEPCGPLMWLTSLCAG